MNDNQNFIVTHRPKVAIFSEISPLSISLVEQLLANFCYVKIFCTDVAYWKTGLTHLKENRFLEIHEIGKLAKEESFDYVLFSTQSYEDKKNERLLVDRAIEFSKNTKSFFILPFSLEKEEERELILEVKKLQRDYPDVGIIYVGDIVGSRLLTKKPKQLLTLLNALVEGRTLKLPPRKIFFYPTSSYDVAKKIVRSLFSFGPYGEEWAIIGQKTSVSEILKLSQKYFPNLTYKITDEDLVSVEVPVKKTITLTSNLETLLKDSFSWLKEHKINTKTSESRENVSNKSAAESFKNYLSLRFVAVLIFIFLFLFFIPLLTMGLSFGGLLYAKKEAFSGNIDVAKKVVNFSSGSLSFSNKFLNISTKVPLVGSIFREPFVVSNILLQTALSAKRLLIVTELSRDLSSQVFSDEVYDPEFYTKQISLNLDATYNDLGFLQGEIQGRKGVLIDYLKRKVDLEELSSFRQKIYYGKKLSDNLAVSLGKGGKKSYLILFQNNMELRPTGGFIGSFALVTFEEGRLVETSVLDVYSADGQLKGHVEPPVPIKDYLGEANWYLRDSNWDPDFVVSAQRAEWFLDKEIDKRVDGVIGIDLEVARSILDVIGPVNLEEYNIEITKDNLYEKTQYEVESEFFPGSRKKSNFLTSLSKKIIFEMTEAAPGKYMLLGRRFLNLLEERHVQVFLHDGILQNSISELGFDGAVSQPTCEGNCFADWIGFVDANLGVNKSNYFVKRNVELNIEVTQDSIRKTLEITYQNSANPVLAATGRYKTYTRALVSPTEEVISVELQEADERKSLDYNEDYIKGRKEIGVLLELPAGDSKKIIFSLQEPSNLSLDNKGEYRLYVRKQAGTDEDPISISFKFPSYLNYTFIPEAFLTKPGVYSYNTKVSRDIFSRISFE